MAHEDEAAAPAREDALNAPGHASEPVGSDVIGLGGTVVARPPDDAMLGAMREIAAALNGEPTPGAL